MSTELVLVTSCVSARGDVIGCISPETRSQLYLSTMIDEHFSSHM